MPFKDPLQNQGASVGRLFIIPCPQPQEAGVGVGGAAHKSSLKAPPHNAQIRASLLSGGANQQSDPLFLSQVKDDKHKCTLGNLTVPLSILLAEEDMTLTQCFPLRNSGPSSTVKLKMALRVRHEPNCTSDAKGAQIDQRFRPIKEFEERKKIRHGELDDT